MGYFFTGYNGHGFDQVGTTEQKYICLYLRNIRKKQSGFTVTKVLELADAPMGTVDTIKRHVQFMLDFTNRKNLTHEDFAVKAIRYATTYCDTHGIKYTEKNYQNK